MGRQEGKAARRRLVVRGIERKVVVNLFIVSFWKIKTGRVPACSEPRIGFRFASQISPRLTVMKHPQWSDLAHSPACLLRLTRGLRRQNWHKVFRARLRLTPPCDPAKRCAG